MWVINDANYIAISPDGSFKELNIRKSSISDVKALPFLGNVNRAQANPLNKTNFATLEISTNDGSKYRIDLNNVSNQAGWPPTQAGLAQAVSDIQSW